MYAKTPLFKSNAITFGLPLIERMVGENISNSNLSTCWQSPHTIVLTHTREFVCKLENELKLMASPHGLVTAMLHGGVSRQEADIMLSGGNYTLGVESVCVCVVVLLSCDV